MRRLFWMGIGAAGAVVLAQRARSAVQSLPDAVTDAVTTQVNQVGQRASTAVRDAVATYRVARAEREAELVGALLVEPAGGTERRPRTTAGPRPAPAVDPWDDDPWGPDEDDA